MSQFSQEILKLKSSNFSIHVNNELFYLGIDNREHYFCCSLYLSISLSSQGKFVSQFS